SGAVKDAKEIQDVFNAMKPADGARPIKLEAQYPDDADHFVLDTEVGSVRIESIVFHGKISVHETEVPIAAIKEYTRSQSGGLISQSALFQEFDTPVGRFAVEV